MYPSRCAAVLLVSGFLIVGSVALPRELIAQGDHGPYSPDKLISAARELMLAARFCALITLDKWGRPQVRTMDPFVPDDDFNVWFGTNRKSRKVEQIRHDPRVALYYLAPEGTGYVAVKGMALLVDDPSEKAHRWKEEWKDFYTDRQADYLLIKVVPEKLEVVDYNNGIVGDPETWKVPSLRLGPEQSHP